jgi:Polyketide cyclase / dehydrase and lipid transport
VTKLHHQLEANCRPERLWNLLADLEAVTRYNPAVRAARLVGSKREGAGAVRECDILPKGGVTERVTVWEEGRALGLEVVRSDWPIHSMRWVTRLDGNGSGTRLAQDLEYRVRFGLAGWLMDQLIMRRMIDRNVEAALRGLIEAAEGHG